VERRLTLPKILKISDEKIGPLRKSVYFDCDSKPALRKSRSTKFQSAKERVFLILSFRLRFSNFLVSRLRQVRHSSGSHSRNRSLERPVFRRGPVDSSVVFWIFDIVLPPFPPRPTIYGEKLHLELSDSFGENFPRASSLSWETLKTVLGPGGRFPRSAKIGCGVFLPIKVDLGGKEVNFAKNPKNL